LITSVGVTGKRKFRSGGLHLHWQKLDLLWNFKRGFVVTLDYPKGFC